MHLSNALKLVILLFLTDHLLVVVQGWTTPPSTRGRTYNAYRPGSCAFVLQQLAKTTTCRHGILDDYNASPGASATDDGDTNNNDDDDAFEELFNNLVFSAGDPRRDIADQWEMCSDPDFLQWLTTKKESSDDEEEELALQDLLDMIEEVTITTTAAISEEEEQAAAEPQIKESVAVASASEPTKMSAADVLKRANDIMSGSSEGEGGPSDFMTDAKAERGLGGFNTGGSMRVGGG